MKEVCCYCCLWSWATFTDESIDITIKYNKQLKYSGVTSEVTLGYQGQVGYHLKHTLRGTRGLGSITYRNVKLFK